MLGSKYALHSMTSVLSSSQAHAVLLPTAYSKFTLCRTLHLASQIMYMSASFEDVAHLSATIHSFNQIAPLWNLFNMWLHAAGPAVFAKASPPLHPEL